VRLATLLALFACSTSKVVGTEAGTEAPQRDASVNVAPTDATALGAAEAPDAADAPDAHADAFDNAIQMLEEAAALIHANEGNCEVMGKRLDEFRQRHNEFLTGFETLFETMPQAERKVVQARYRARFKAAWAKLRPGVGKCKQEPTVNLVLQKLWG
jgi:ABC-type transporter Mla subunit MlaD